MKRLVFLAAGMFATGCDSYVIAGLLPGIGDTLSASAAAVGQGITAFALAYVVSAPLFAVLLAGKRARNVLITALSVFALGNVLTLVSPDLVLYLTSRAVAGVGAGLFTPVAVAAATAMAGERSRGRALSLVWGANSAGAVAGVPLGMWLAGHSGWRWAIGLILLFAAAALAGIALRQPDLQVPPPLTLAARVRALADRRVLSVVGVTMITATGSLGLYTYVAPLILESAAAYPVTAALWIWSVGGLLGSTAIGYLVDRTGRPRLLMAAILVLLAAAVPAVPLLRSLPVLGLLPFLVWGAAGWATVTPQQHTLISMRPEQAASVAALNGSAIGLGSALGAGLGGLFIAGGLGAPNLAYASACLLVVALCWQLALLRPAAVKAPS